MAMAGEPRAKVAQKHSGAPLPAVRLGAAVAPRAAVAPKAPLKPRVSMPAIEPRVATEEIPAAPKSTPAPPKSSRDPMNPLAVMSLSSIRIPAAQPLPAPPSRPAVAQIVPPPPPSRPATHYQQAFESPPVTARAPMISTPAAFSAPTPGAPPSDAAMPPPAPSSAPPAVRYERAFRAWSHPALPPYQANDDLEQPSTGPLTYSVYTASDMPAARPSMPGPLAPPPHTAPMSLGAKIAMTLTGVCVVFGTAAVIILGLADDAPHAKAATVSAAPPPVMVDTMPPPVPDSTSITTTTASYVPATVSIVDDTPPPAPAPLKKKKKVVTTGVTSAAPPPNPYAK